MLRLCVLDPCLLQQALLLHPINNHSRVASMFSHIPQAHSHSVQVTVPAARSACERRIELKIANAHAFLCGVPKTVNKHCARRANVVHTCALQGQVLAGAYALLPFSFLPFASCLQLIRLTAKPCWMLAMPARQNTPHSQRQVGFGSAPQQRRMARCTGRTTLQ